MEIIGLFFMCILAVAASIVAAVLAVLLAALVLQALWFVFWTHLIATLAIVLILFVALLLFIAYEDPGMFRFSNARP